MKEVLDAYICSRSVHLIECALVVYGILKSTFEKIIFNFQICINVI